MADAYKKSPEWQALNRIWKSIPQEAREGIKADFKLLADYIKPAPKPDPAPAPMQVEENYLSGMSALARKFALKSLTKDSFNIYEYLMQLIPRAKASDEEELWDAYISERDDGEENEDALRDIISICVKRARERGMIE